MSDDIVGVRYLTEEEYRKIYDAAYSPVNGDIIGRDKAFNRMMEEAIAEKRKHLSAPRRGAQGRWNSSRQKTQAYGRR